MSVEGVGGARNRWKNANLSIALNPSGVVVIAVSVTLGGGLGPLAGLVWRIGLMGESSRHEHVVTLLSGRMTVSQVLEDLQATIALVTRP